MVDMPGIKKFMELNNEQEVALNLDEDVVVEAGAGSGKTRALVARYLHILERGRGRVDEIVAITFTENAATEMRERIREKINEYVDKFGEINFLNRAAVRRLPNSPISTIHGFAARILKENPLECNLPPNFMIIKGFEKKLFLEETINDFIKKFLESDKKDENELLVSVLSEQGYDHKRIKEVLLSIIEYI